MRRAIVKHRATFAAIIGLVIAATLVGGYILVNQRLKLPTEDRYSVEVAMPTAQALTPGQGQDVTVAGVEVGEVGRVRLQDGRAIVRLDLLRDELDAVHVDAKVVTRPRTGLQDMTLELDPGSRTRPVLQDGDVLPVSRSTPNVNVDEVLAGLDADTRPYLQGLLQGFARGTRGRGGLDVRRLLAATQPTVRSTRRLTAAIRGRRVELRRLVGNLAQLSEALGPQGDDLRRLVAGANGTFGTLAAEDESLRSALARLPGTLRAADGALGAARPLAAELGPAAEELVPAADALPEALSSARALARGADPAVDRLRSLSRSAPSTARQLSAALGRLEPTVPTLRRATDVLEYVANELGHNPEGKEEGYLFWLAWFAHNTNSMLSSRDANAGFWRGMLIATCSNVDALSSALPVLKPAADAGICPK